MKRLVPLLLMLMLPCITIANPVDGPTADTTEVVEEDYYEGFDSLFSSDDSSLQELLNLLNANGNMDTDYDDWFEQQQKSAEYFSNYNKERSRSSSGRSGILIAVGVIVIIVKIVLLASKK